MRLALVQCRYPDWLLPPVILTTSPGLIEASAEIAAGTKSARSGRRLVGPHRITIEMLRSDRFCWCGMF